MTNVQEYVGYKMEQLFSQNCCRICSRPLTSACKSGLCKSCSQVERAKVAPKKDVSYTCQLCGKEFSVLASKRVSTRKYCTECSIVAEHKRNAEGHKRRKEEGHVPDARVRFVTMYLLYDADTFSRGCSFPRRDMCNEVLRDGAAAMEWIPEMSEWIDALGRTWRVKNGRFVSVCLLPLPAHRYYNERVSAVAKDDDWL